jgi:hypothetical protein
MSVALAKKVTPTAAFRAIMAPYRDKIERYDAARGKLEGRLRRAFDLFDEEMRSVWTAEMQAEATTPDNGEPLTQRAGMSDPA